MSEDEVSPVESTFEVKKKSIHSITCNLSLMHTCYLSCKITSSLMDLML